MDYKLFLSHCPSKISPLIYFPSTLDTFSGHEITSNSIDSIIQYHVETSKEDVRTKQAEKTKKKTV